MIAKNPMQKVDAPKKEKKPVDALTKEQAARLFSTLSTCPLDFRCILQLLVTTGMRRGECMGLKWRDIDEKACTISIAEVLSYNSGEDFWLFIYFLIFFLLLICLKM